MGISGSNQELCVCKSHNYLIVERYYVSRGLVLIVLITCFIFIAGYFIGKNHAIALIAGEIDQQSFADQFHHSMTLMYRDTLLENKQANKQPLVSQDLKVSADTFREKRGGDKFYAQLAGFGSIKTAENMVNRLQKKGIVTTIVKHVSKPIDTKMPEKIWYQVVTPPSDLKQIERVVALVKKNEYINNPRIEAVKGS